MSSAHLYGVREDGDLSANCPAILVKTSDKYVTYVTPVTDLKLLFELTESGGPLGSLTKIDQGKIDDRHNTMDTNLHWQAA